MSSLARLQLIGPVALLIGIAGAEGAALALAHAPGSEALWYLHLNVFGPFWLGDDILGVYSDLAHGQLYLIALPLFLIACGGFYFRRMLRIPTIVTTASDTSRPPVPIDRDQCVKAPSGAFSDLRVWARRQARRRPSP